MVSGWLVYLILKLTAVQTVCAVVGGISAVAAVVMFILTVAAPSTPSERLACRKVSRLFNWICLLTFPFGLLLPTSKEAAAIYLVPRIASVDNVEALEGEALELYRMAKGALKDVLCTPESTPAEEEATND